MKNVNWVEVVFWVMNISNRMRIRKLMISVDYMVVVWVNLMGGLFGVLLGIELGIVVLLSG